MFHCKACGFVKSEPEFYQSNKSKCKECVKAAARSNRLNNIEKVRAYDRSRGNRQPEIYLKEYRKANRGKYKAHNKVNNAIRDGKIKKEPCESCGDRKSVAHHDDYAHPLKVRWLCQAHHKQWHAEHGEAPNGKDGCAA